MAGSSQDDVSVVDSVTTAVLFITRFSSVLQLDLGGGDSFRRTWDSRKYEKLARDRADTDREGSTLPCRPSMHITFHLYRESVGTCQTRDVEGQRL